MLSAPEGCGVPLVAGGDSLVAHRGVVGHGTELLPVLPGRHDEHNARHGFRHSTAGRRKPGATMEGCNGRFPPPSPTAPARTNSRTAPVASSTWARPRAC